MGPDDEEETADSNDLKEFLDERFEETIERMDNAERRDSC